MNTIYSFPQPENEKVQTYAKGSSEREKIQAALTEIRDIVMEVPVIIDGKPVYTDDVMEITAPPRQQKGNCPCAYGRGKGDRSSHRICP